MRKFKIPIEVSARHIHINKEDFKKLFNKENLTVFKKLKQNQFSAKETLDLEYKNKLLKNIRIVGPFRENTLVELSLTDFIYLKLKPVFYIGLKREKIDKTDNVKLIGPNGVLKINRGIIVHLRHIHLDLKTAKKLKLKDGEKVDVEILGKRGAILKNVYIRVNENFNPSLHLDTDEGNAVGIIKKGWGYILK